MAAQPGVRRVGLRSERGPILAAIMLGTSLVAIDATIVATAVPAIVADVGGFTAFPWLFSLYLLAQAVTVPIYGKLSDLHGRKPVVLVGIGVFAAGSVLCGLAWSMPALIAARLVQGLGAGAILPMTVTIAGDVYTVEERARIQGYIASVWAAAAVAGPALGGVFADYLHWRWIFLVNIPFCAAAAYMLARHLREAPARDGHRIDYLGAALLAVGASAVMLGLLEGGQAWAWASPQSAAAFGVGAAALVGFVLAQRRAAEPVLPGWVVRRRVLAASSLVAVLVGAIIIGLTSYVPTYTQGVLGTGALAGGFTLATMTLGWPLSAAQAGRVYLRFGFRACGVAGAAVAAAGALLVASVDTGVWVLAAGCFVVGLGLGLVSTPTLIAAQASVGWQERGVVTAANMFARSVGSAVGVAVFGALANARLRDHGGTTPPAAELAQAGQVVFAGVAVAALLLVLAAVWMPGRGQAPPA